MRRLMIVAVLVLVGLPTLAEGVLFVRPVHVTREVSDSLSGERVVIEEYLAGDRVISIRGDRTSIADYANGRLTEIDRAAGTYSVTRFETIASLRGSAMPSASRRRPVEIEDAGPASVASVPARRFRAVIDRGGESRTTFEVAIADEPRLSREALEVLTGSAWPGNASEETAVVMEAARRVLPDNQGRSLASHGFPVEQISVVSAMGEEVRTVNRVLRIGSELPDPLLVAIPPGAREVLSTIVEQARMMDELDRLPTEGSRP